MAVLRTKRLALGILGPGSLDEREYATVYVVPPGYRAVVRDYHFVLAVAAAAPAAIRLGLVSGVVAIYAAQVVIPTGEIMAEGQGQIVLHPGDQLSIENYYPSNLYYVISGAEMPEPP